MAYIEYHGPEPGDSITRISSIHPAALRAHLSFYRTLVQGASPLSRERREMVAVTVSQINECHY